MDFAEYKRKKLRLNETRIYTVKNSIGAQQIYRASTKDSPIKLVKEQEFYKIVRTLNKYIGEEILKGNRVVLPYNMGIFEVCKKPPKTEFKDGKLVTNLPIDWDRTLRLWYSDPKEEKKKTLLRKIETEIYSICYNRTAAKYKNKTFYRFNPNKSLKNKLKNLIQEGEIDAFNFVRYE